MPYDFDGRWHPPTEQELTAQERTEHVWRLIQWGVAIALLAIVLGWAYNAGLMKNERPDYLEPGPAQIDTPGHG